MLLSAFRHELRSQLTLALAATATVILADVALGYEKFRFRNGLAIGIAIASATMFRNSGRSLGLGRPGLEQAIVAAVSAAVTMLVLKLFK